MKKLLLATALLTTPVQAQDINQSNMETLSEINAVLMNGCTEAGNHKEECAKRIYPHGYQVGMESRVRCNVQKNLDPELEMQRCMNGELIKILKEKFKVIYEDVTQPPSKNI